MDQVSAALDAAQWKEIVSVTTTTTDPGHGGHHDDDDNDDNNNNNNQGYDDGCVNLVATLDPVHGGLTWQPVPHADLLSRHLQAKQWILPMLNDGRRNRLYYQALQEVLLRDAPKGHDDNEDAQPSLSPLHVMDLGCGTGLLGIMAAQIDPTARVTSLDMSSVMADLARQTVTLAQQHNNGLRLQDRINIIQGHSTQLPPCRAHVCVSELLEDGLLGEGWLDAMRDVWQRHLLRGGEDTRVIPCGATVYAQLMQGAWLSDYTGPKPFVTTQQQGSSRSSSCCIDFVPSPTRNAEDDDDDDETCTPTPVIPLHVHALIRQGHLRPLSDPVTMLHFDVSAADRIPGPEGRTVHRMVTSRTAGTVHAVLVWWTLHLTPNLSYELYNPISNDDDSDPTTTTKDHAQDHWHPCVHVLSKPVDTTENQSWTLQARHDNHGIQVKLLEQPTTDGDVPKRRMMMIPEPSLLPAFSPGRTLQLNQTSRLRALERGIQYNLQNIEPRTNDDAVDAASTTVPSLVVLDLSDFCVGALVAAANTSAQTTSIFSLERVQASRAVQAIQANGMSTRIQILQGHFEQVSHEILTSNSGDNDNHQSKPRTLLVVAEPAYPQLHYWPHLEALQYYYVMRGLHTRLSPSTSSVWNITSVPGQARLWAAALQSDELATAYGECDALAHDFGVPHQHVTEQHFGPDGVRELSLSLWQYDYTLLTEAMQVGTLSFNGAPIQCCTVTTPFVKTGVCHGVVVWVEYEYRTNADDNSGKWSNHPTNLGTRQLVYIWKTAVPVDDLDKGLQLQGRCDLDRMPFLRFDTTATRANRVVRSKLSL